MYYIRVYGVEGTAVKRGAKIGTGTGLADARRKVFDVAASGPGG